MKKQNHLAGQTSPYLLQHVDNPVDWYPWGKEAFAKARAEDKPVFLSIGYSACHWCHVMAHESFENDDVAAILNGHFVCIKVDREEYPDLDHFYMTATSLITGRGGWPNSVWLLPDGRPWYAGTYFPREDRPGMSGFKTILHGLARLWATKRDSIHEQADQLTEAIRKEEAMPSGKNAAHWNAYAWTSHAQEFFRHQFDPRWGGFGSAPKFPPHSGLLLLFHTLANVPNHETEVILQATLDAMALGGIRDHVGGGFHRYSTDERWFLPHFEKMLYDNALLLKLYARAAAFFDQKLYRRVALDLYDWLTREMTHPDGGFYAALDADSEGEEGKFYTWTAAELRELIDPARVDAFFNRYQIQPEGNFQEEATGHFTGRNIPVPVLSSSGKDVGEFDDILQTLRAVREQRVRPGLDHKIIAAWNGLMISALATAGRELNEPSFIMTAVRAREFINRNLMPDGQLVRCWSGTPSPQPGRLEDYAALAVADLDLYHVTGQERYLEQAAGLVQQIRERFFDEKTGELYMTTAAEAIAGVRVKSVIDQGAPSGTGLALQAAFRVAHLMNDAALAEMARRATAACHGVMQRVPSMTATLIDGLLWGGEHAESPAAQVNFTLKPDTVLINQSGTADVTLAAQVPAGWSLNEMFKLRAKKASAIAVRWKAPAPPVSVKITATGPQSWNLHFRKKDPSMPFVGSAALNIQYQACSASECLPAETTPVTVHFE